MKYLIKIKHLEGINNSGRLLIHNIYMKVYLGLFAAFVAVFSSDVTAQSHDTHV
jgi:hypothetical protein